MANKIPEEIIFWLQTIPYENVENLSLENYFLAVTERFKKEYDEFGGYPVFITFDQSKLWHNIMMLFAEDCERGGEIDIFILKWFTFKIDFFLSQGFNLNDNVKYSAICDIYDHGIGSHAHVQTLCKKLIRYYIEELGVDVNLPGRWTGYSPFWAVVLKYRKWSGMEIMDELFYLVFHGARPTKTEAEDIYWRLPKDYIEEIFEFMDNHAQEMIKEPST